MLGTGTPRPTPDIWGPATAVVVGERVFLVDAGVGVERRLAAAGLPVDGVTAAFITHLHSDHVLGLSDLIFTSWVMGRTRPFPVYGPHGLDQMIRHLYEAFSEDIRIRTEGLEHESRDGYRVDVREIGPSVVYDSGGVRVTAFLVNHGEWREAYGYRFDSHGRSIVLSGDTSPSEELVRMATGVDVLIHEVQPSDSTQHPGNRSAGEWARYVACISHDRVAAGRAGGAGTAQAPRRLSQRPAGPGRSDPRRHPAIVLGTRDHRVRSPALLRRVARHSRFRLRSIDQSGFHASPVRWLCATR